VIFVSVTVRTQWERARKLLPVEVTSAIELDDAIVQSTASIGSESQPASRFDLSSRVDPEILGWLVLASGTSVLDSYRCQPPEQLRKQVGVPSASRK